MSADALSNPAQTTYSILDFGYLDWLASSQPQESAYHRVLTQEVEHPTSSACAPNERDFAD